MHPRLLSLLVLLLLLLVLPEKQAQAQGTGFVGCDEIVQIPIEECNALELFFNSTLGHRWFRNDGWLRANQPCGWYGVVCNSKEWPRNVIKIELINNSVGGILPSEIVLLKELEEFNISNLQASIQAWKIEGNIPSEYGTLKKLRVLNLTHNELIGDLPDQLGELDSLEFLSLRGNQLDDFIPGSLGQIANLKTLDLSENLLRGNIPDSLGNLSNLQSLDLSDNRLVDFIPDSFGNLSSLINLDLANNDLRGTPTPSIARLDSLVRLNLSGNRFEGLLTPDFVTFASTRPSCNLYGDASSLCIPQKEIYNLADQTEVCGVPVEEVCTSCIGLDGAATSACSDLENLYFATGGPDWVQSNGWLASPTICDWSGIGCEQDQVMSFELPANNLTGSLPDFLDALPALSTLNLSDNRLEGVLPFSVAEKASRLPSCNLAGNSPLFCMPADSAYLSLGAGSICGVPLQSSCSPTREIAIIQFEVQKQGNRVVATWQASRGSASYTYELQQKTGNQFITRANQVGIESDGAEQLYSLELESVEGDLLIFRIAQINPNGSVVYSNEVTLLPDDSPLLLRAFPNPARDQLHIQLVLSEEKEGTLELFNVQGQSVLTLLSVSFSSSLTTHSFDLAGLPAGLYFLRFDSNTLSQTIPITIRP